MQLVQERHENIMRKNNIYLYYFIYLFIFIYSSLVIILLICVISTTQILAQKNTSIIPTVAVPLKILAVVSSGINLIGIYLSCISNMGGGQMKHSQALGTILIQLHVTEMQCWTQEEIRSAADVAAVTLSLYVSGRAFAVSVSSGSSMKKPSVSPWL